jgi:hypothetical protein
MVLTSMAARGCSWLLDACRGHSPLLCPLRKVHAVPRLLVCAQIFAQKHSTDSKERWLSGNTVCFRMNRISDVYFVGGFGTVQWLDVAEYMAATPDSIVMHQPLRVLQVRHLAASRLHPVIGDWRCHGHCNRNSIGRCKDSDCHSFYMSSAI